MYQQIKELPALSSSDEILEFFKIKNKHVITFAGFGELGYQENTIVERIASKILKSFNPETLIVNCGTLLRIGGEDGIACVFKLANTLGIETSGIHASVALNYANTHVVSPFEQNSFFIEDASWGGFLDDNHNISPTLQMMLNVTHELIVIGGGKHAADELIVFLKYGKQVQYYPAEMNHLATRAWCKRDGVNIDDYRGEAYFAWHNR